MLSDCKAIAICCFSNWHVFLKHPLPTASPTPSHETPPQMPGILPVMSKTKKLSEFLHKDERYKGANVSPKVTSLQAWLSPSRTWLIFCYHLQLGTVSWCAVKGRSNLL